MAKKSATSAAVPAVSPAVQKAASKAVQAVAVDTTETEPTGRGAKQFTAEQYLAEYLEEQKNGGTWESLCDRTGFTLGNVRQCITMLRSEYRKAMLEKANASVDFMKQLSKIKKDVEVWADEKAEQKFPFLNASGTRNTQKAKMRKSWENEELSL